MNEKRRKALALFVLLGIALIAAIVVLLIRASDTRRAPESEAPRAHASDPAIPSGAPVWTTPAAGTIQGTVRDAGSAPIANAMVCATISSESSSPPVCTTTDPEGGYSIANLQAARYSVVASAQGHQPATYRDAQRNEWVRLGPGQRRDGIDFHLRQGGVEVRGYVKDVGGGGIADALVSVRSWSSESVAFTRSSEEGSFRAWVEEGPFMARAAADNYADGWTTGTAPGPEVEIVLTPGSVLVGRVVRAATQEPVQGVEVTSGFDGWGETQRTVRSDAEGRFRFRGLAPGRYKPAARISGGFGRAARSVLLGIAQTSREVVIELQRAPNVSGSVVVVPGDAPCPAGQVALIAGQMGRNARVAPIQSDGSVQFEGMSPGDYQVHVDCDDHAAEPYPTLTVQDADVLGARWTVRPGVQLRGSVVDEEGNPVQAMITASSAEGGFGRFGARSQTQEDGTFLLRGLREGPLRVMASPRGFVDPPPTEVDLRSDTPPIRIVVERGGSIEGKVLDEAQEPVAGARIMVASQGPIGFRPPSSSLSDGSFSIQGLKPGDYRVTASYEGEATSPFAAPRQGPESAAATVRVGMSVQIKLVLPERKGTIHGRVVDDDGGPIADAFVRADREAQPGGGRMMLPSRAVPVVTDPDGMFTLDRLPPGTYTVHAFEVGGGNASIEHVALGSTVTIPIKQTGSVSGTVELEKGGAPTEFSIGMACASARVFRQESFLRTDGAFTMTDLPPGEYRLVATANEGTAGLDVALVAGQDKQDVALKLSTRASLRGRVVALEDRQPVAGVTVRAFSRDAMATASPQREQAVTDARGEFALSDVSAGSVMVMVMPDDPMRTERDAAFIPFDVVSGRENDAGEIMMAKRRMQRDQQAGELGVELVQPPPMSFGARPLEVATVQEPAAKAGIVPGDVIVSVDGYDVSGRNAYLYQTLVRVPAGTTLRLGLERGTIVSLTVGAPM